MKKVNENIAFEKGVKDLAVSLDKQTITVTYKGVTATYTVKINEKLVFAAFFKGIKDYVDVTDDAAYPFTPMQTAEGNYLQSSNTSSKSTITLKAKKTV